MIKIGINMRLIRTGESWVLCDILGCKIKNSNNAPIAALEKTSKFP